MPFPGRVTAAPTVEAWLQEVAERLANVERLVLTPTLAVAYRSAAQTLAVNVFERVKLDTAVYDPQGALNLTTGVYTAPVAGYYLAAGEVLINTGITQIITCAIYRNSAEVARGSQISAPGSSYGTNVTTIVQAEAGETIELWGIATGGAPLFTGSQYNRLSVVKLT